MNTMPKVKGFKQESRLFQRVCAPRGFVNPFSFGGGGSGVNPRWEDALSSIFSWDYMGAAEYEFGAAGRCLQFMRENAAELAAHEFQVGGTTWYALTHRKHKGFATALWINVVSGAQKLKESADTNNPKIRGWFDFENGWFVSRDKEMRDNLKLLLKGKS